MNDIRHARGQPKANVELYRQSVVSLAGSIRARIIVEVGVYRGILSRRLALLPTLEQLHLVDSWLGSTPERQPPFYMPDTQEQMDWIAAEVKAWASTTGNVRVIHADSVVAARTFADGSICFGHIDGDHTVEGVIADIGAWYPKIRPGGILSGDNYEMPSVAEAVDRWLKRRQFTANGRVWYTVVR